MSAHLAQGSRTFANGGNVNGAKCGRRKMGPTMNPNSPALRALTDESPVATDQDVGLSATGWPNLKDGWPVPAFLHSMPCDPSIGHHLFHISSSGRRAEVSSPGTLPSKGLRRHQINAACAIDALGYGPPLVNIRRFCGFRKMIWPVPLLFPFFATWNRWTLSPRKWLTRNLAMHRQRTANLSISRFSTLGCVDPVDFAVPRSWMAPLRSTRGMDRLLKTENGTKPAANAGKRQKLFTCTHILTSDLRFVKLTASDHGCPLPLPPD